MKVNPQSRRIAVLLSGRGSNFGAIADRIAGGTLDAEIALVLSNKPDAAGIAEARRRGVETVCVPPNRDREAYGQAMAAELQRRRVSLVCLAGFMRILGSSFVRAFPRAILNIHPSLLPAFPGLNPQQQALDHGVRFSGCTVHFVDDSLDGGPIVMQAVVPIEAGDTVETLSDRILAKEHSIYSTSIGLVLDGRCEIRGRRVIIHDN